MKIAFFDTKPYDKKWFSPLLQKSDYKAKFFDYKLNEDTAVLTKGYDAVCVFVNDTLNDGVINTLKDNGVGLIALRCAGYNNVDIKSAKKAGIKVARVPSYSPSAVAEFSMALLLTANRKTHKAFYRTRDYNFQINGLMGFDLAGKTVGVVGTGQIGKKFINICKGFEMEVLAYDPYPDKDADINYTDMETIFAKADIISLHCPLNRESYHIIDENSILKMKRGVVIVNTSRGALIDTTALIEGLKSGHIGGAGLDVYEEEGDIFFEDYSAEIIRDDELKLLLSYPNVIVTSHQGFFTKEAMSAIATKTMENFECYDKRVEIPSDLTKG